MVAVFAQVQYAIAVGIFTRVQPAIGIDVLRAGAQNAITVEVFGEVLEARTQLVVDRRRAEQLQAGVDNGLSHRVRNRPVEGVEVDFNVFGLHRQDRGVHTHQTGIAHGCLGGDEFRNVLVQPRDHVEQGRLHDRQTEVHVVNHQPDRALIDVIGQAIRNDGTGVGVDAADQIGAIAVGSTDPGKTGQIRAAQRQGFDMQRHRIDGGVEHLTELIGNRCQAAQIDCDVKLFALAEGQRAAQEKEIGHRNFGQSDVQAHDLAAIEGQQHRRATGADLQTLAAIAVGDARIDRHRAHEAAQRLAAGVDINRDVVAQDLEHIAQPVDAHFIGMCGEREHALRVHERRQIGLEAADGNAQVLQAEADQVALFRERQIKVRITDADKHVDVAGAKGQALEGHVMRNRVVVRDVEQGLDRPSRRHARDDRTGDAIDHSIGRQAHQGVQTGGHIGGKGLPQAELEVAVEVNKVANVETQVRQRDGAGDAGQANTDVDVFEEFQAALEPVRCRRCLIRNQIRQALQADAGQEHVGIECRHFRHAEIWQPDVGQIEREAEIDGGQLEGEIKLRRMNREQVEDAQVGLHAHTQEVRVEAHVHRRGIAAYRDVQALAAVDDAEVGIDRRQRNAVHNGAVELKHHVLRVERQIRVGADQTGQAGLGAQAKEVQRQFGTATERRRHQGQGKVEVGNGKADRVVVGFVNAVVVAVGLVGTIETGKGLHVLTGHDQGIRADHQVHAKAMEAHAVDDPLLEGKAAFERQEACHLGRGMTNRGLDQFIAEIEHDWRAAGWNAEAS